MRLLRLEEDGNFSLVEYVEKDIPQYAILSHTWGADHEEPTYKDLLKGTGRNKAGYRKLTLCGAQAAKDDLGFFWVDTCCINKSSSRELDEAINSMFRWYQKAARCYAYLADVSVDRSAGENDFTPELKAAFARSRWFTRGWTLQELIAPRSVDFFSKEGHWLGSKHSLQQILAEITGIALAALQGTPLSHFSTEERISLAANRQAKREEDAAYSLLGIFNIHMPLLYGEGRKEAFDRLREKIDDPLASLRRYVYQQTQRLDTLDITAQWIVRQMTNKPKQLGYPWETGMLEDHLKIDDGLGAEYFLPVSLCETLEVVGPSIH
ncbi:HET-domain-containing protein [Westerdykella ornata]|uniref:HET-domain-containing protein n=1 Tax=Westerdykella ornata TaxID=318751 RepID=A0A6A6JLP7_WESOR|nr:HET-domain-containing protein [Westerdykella ornata]KAF2276576.1 HET-domain-containing protein [Westerdykella ornata]